MELRGLIDIVKQHDFLNKELQNRINQINNQYKELSADINGEKQLKRLKASLIELKGEIKEASLNEGVIENLLFSSTHMRAGKHHLYDDILPSPSVRGTADKPPDEEYNFEEFN